MLHFLVFLNEKQKVLFSKSHSRNHLLKTEMIAGRSPNQNHVFTGQQTNSWELETNIIYILHFDCFLVSVESSREFLT